LAGELADDDEADEDDDDDYDDTHAPDEEDVRLSSCASNLQRCCR
jgi:hypothetical protein